MYITGHLVLAGFFITVKTDETYNELVCENEQMNLSCPKGHTIDILDAMYGKKDNRICNYPTQKTIGCEAFNSLNAVKTKCNNRQKCLISASNTLFGDPCTGYLKYLEVSYRCLKNDNILSLITCEHDKFEIKCPEDHYIKIVNALYGKKNPLTCYKENSPQLSNQCGSLTAADILESRCNNLSECSGIAENRLFGDPCKTTYKYLEVDYLCINGRKPTPSNAQDTAISPSIAKETATSPSIAQETAISPSITQQTAISPSIARETAISPSNAQQTAISPSIAQVTAISPSNAQVTTISPSNAQVTTISPSNVQDIKMKLPSYVDALPIRIPEWRFPHSMLERLPEIKTS